ncbi:meiosis regulator and mRNA stability factor 1 isoform X2 [Episyrphus balteatus]|uniref:meiosis regulator and mRNA stability factor 1 isoform X2 n=1 Tax=Episyrphus balteatus TaxID=286459 RepID=UPI002486CB08|nr:meiosis regulator and mRNA stability factor 1 isoform X2 [Episyrphus balteatus]
MADRFFSLYPDEANSFINYNSACLQSTGLVSSSSSQQLLSQSQSLAGDFNPTSLSSAYFSSTAVDVNNNPICQNNVITGVELNTRRNSSMMNYFATQQQNFNKVGNNNSSILKNTNNGCGSQTTYMPPSSLSSSMLNQQMMQQQQQQQCQYTHNNGNGCFNRHRYMPYNHNRACATAAAAASASSGLGNSTINPVSTATSLNMQFQQYAPIYQNCSNSSMMLSSQSNSSGSGIYDNSSELDFSYANVVGTGPTATTTSALANTSTTCVTSAANTSLNNGKTGGNGTTQYQSNGSSPGSDLNQVVTLQINNLDYSMDEASLRNFLINQLKPITPVVSLVFEGSSFAKVTVPNLNFAKQVVANLHRKKIGHKRMIVSYTRDSSLTEFNTLRCQVAGLLKDVPYYTLPMYKFRELFQSRFKTSISVLDLYKMQDICNINADSNEEKFISLQPELFNSLDSSPLMEGLQHSVPYCTIHFKREQHKGWAEQEIEPLPNVCMTISEIEQIIYPLLKSHPGDIPVASLVHCVEGELNIQIAKNENGVNLEHLVCCVHGIQINTNSFGNKILAWLEQENNVAKDNGDNRFYAKNATVSDPLYQISREVVELMKMSPKSTMKFNRFIPAYHNHFGKQCRVADYGYTKLIELFEALSTVVQIMGDGENRQITLTHRTQVRRFTSDLLRILRALGNKSVLLSQLPLIFSQIQHRSFDITDYGVCDIVDILDGLVNSNIVTVSTVQNGKDILISIPQRKQTSAEIEKTSIFASEVVELFRSAPQYSILFQKFVRCYHYHFAYQCRLSDYGFFKLADLMEAIQGVVEMEQNNDEDKKVFLSPKIARRVLSEQLEELIREFTGSSKTCMKLDDVLELHKKKFGYNIQPQVLGVADIHEGINVLPFVEVLKNENSFWIICHNDNAIFRTQCYRSCNIIQEHGKEQVPMNDFISSFSLKYHETLPETSIAAMKHAVEIVTDHDTKFLRISSFMKFLMGVIQFIEHRTMLLSEIKNALNVDYINCFQYGFPNLYTILRAYPDVFSVNTGQTQERSEISLILQSELVLPLISRTNTNSVLQSNNQQKQQSSKKLSSTTKLRPQQRLPLSENNNNRSSLINNNNNNNKTSDLVASKIPQQSIVTNKGPLSGSHFYPKQQSIPTKQQQPQPMMANNSNINNNNNNSGGNMSNTTTTTTNSNSCFNTSSNSSNFNNILNTTATSSSNKENSFNNSAFNVSFNSSMNSLSDPNTSMGSVNGGTPAAIGFSKLWDRRRGNYYNSTTVNANTEQANSCIFEMTNVNMQMCPVYEPPKPDTPPSDNMPFWIDPIWANSNGEKPPKINPLNIKLAQLKAFNISPMILSPYTLSKTENMKQQMFSFDNHDRKIA